jgi:hypothetical protein
MSRAIALVIAALVACGPGDPPSDPEPAPTDEPQPAPTDPEPPQSDAPPEEQPGTPPAEGPQPLACDPTGSWRVLFTRTGSTGGYCSGPGLAAASWSIRIFDVGATGFSYEGTSASGNRVAGTGTLDRATCAATIASGYDGVLAREPDGTEVSGSIASEHRMTFGAATLAGEGRETFRSDEPHPSFPCTVTWRIDGTR